MLKSADKEIVGNTSVGLQVVKNESYKETVHPLVQPAFKIDITGWYGMYFHIRIVIKVVVKHLK